MNTRKNMRRRIESERDGTRAMRKSAVTPAMLFMAKYGVRLKPKIGMESAIRPNKGLIALGAASAESKKLKQ